MILATKLKTPELFEKGYALRSFPVPPEFENFIRQENWNELDAAFRKLTSPGGSFFEFLKTFHEFSSIEFIISIRDSANEWEEDGIWHDDGTRVFAFSLSLSLEASEIEGGHLELRRKEQESLIGDLPTPPYGTAILFLTGVHGYEHRTRQVLKGRRIILAGWCSE